MDVGWLIGIVLGLGALWAASIVGFWLLRPKGVPLAELVRVVPDVVRLLRSIISDRNAPLDVRLALVGLLIWIISPIDLIPEFVPVIGPLDDVVVAIVALRYTRRRLGIDNLRTRWAGTPQGFELLSRALGGSSSVGAQDLE